MTRSRKASTDASGAAFKAFLKTSTPVFTPGDSARANLETDLKMGSQLTGYCSVGVYHQAQMVPSPSHQTQAICWDPPDPVVVKRVNRTG